VEQGGGDVCVDTLVTLATDVDDMAGEYLAAAADRLRGAGALDVVLVPTLMKKGRPGTRLEALVRPVDADRIEALLFAHTTTLGVRRSTVERRALAREMRTVDVDICSRTGYVVRGVTECPARSPPAVRRTTRWTQAAHDHSGLARPPGNSRIFLRRCRWPLFGRQPS
jgi:hypothetical protein